MSTKLNKPITRETDSLVFDRSQHRNLIVSVEPTRTGALIGVRIKGTRDTYRLSVQSVFNMAITEHQRKVERTARRIHKDEGVAMRTAKARAKKEVAKELR